MLTLIIDQLYMNSIILVGLPVVLMRRELFFLVKTL
jgi:hypothetical protein